MEKTLIIDCGKHSTKYSCLSSKKKIGTDVKIRYSAAENLSPIRASQKEWFTSLSDILSDYMEEDNNMTIVFLVQTLFPRREKEALLVSAFEYFGARNVCIEYVPCAALFSVGETQGTVFDAGYTGVRITPVVQGSPLFDYSSSFHDIGAFFAEDELASYLSPILLPYGNNSPSLVSQIFSGFTERTNEAVSSPHEVVLPDGSSLFVSIPPDVFHRAEERLLYSSKTNFIDEVWFTHLRTTNILSSTHFLRIGGASENKYFANSIFSLFHRNRMTDHSIEVQTNNSRCAPVLGGCILSQLSSFKSLCISVADYTEEGPHGCSRLSSNEISR